MKDRLNSAKQKRKPLSKLNSREEKIQMKHSKNEIMNYIPSYIQKIHQIEKSKHNEKYLFGTCSILMFSSPLFNFNSGFRFCFSSVYSTI